MLVDTVSHERFVWRGVTAFRLLHMLAHGEDAESAIRTYQTLGFNLVRVLTTTVHAFNLPAAVGRTKLASLLALCDRLGMRVEIVALADTVNWTKQACVDHLADVCHTATQFLSPVIEGGNEIGPRHGTQHPEIASICRSFHAPSSRPFCPGSVHGGDLCKDRDALTATQWAHGQDLDRWPYWDEVFTYAGSYGTSHLHRSTDRWNRVRHVRELETSSHESGVFFVDDEPQGADEHVDAHNAGSRDNASEAFFCQGALSRVFEVGSTFHSQAGLTCAPFGPVQQRCAEAFVRGTRVVADSTRLTFKNSGWGDSPIKSFTGATRVYSAIGKEPISVVVGALPGLSITTQNGYTLGPVIDEEGGCRVYALRH